MVQLGSTAKIVGKKFGILTALRRVGSDKSKKNSVWLCRCDCGNYKELSLPNLKLSTNCGCMTSELLRRSNTTHGKSNSRIYHIWNAMLQRCYNKNTINYERYGGRGIRVSKQWHKFENFYNDMKNGYSDKLTLERIDNYGNYSPQNCCWVTYKKQANNTRRNKLITFRGETLNQTQMLKKYGINRGAFNTRIKNNWSLEKALTTPIRKHKEYKNAKNKK